MTATPATVRLDQLEPHPGNVRTDLGDLTELAISIRAHGIIQPLVVQPLPDDHFRLVTGHRRAAAAALAGRTRVPVVVRTDLNSTDVLAVMLVENMQRRSLTPLEEAHALASLKTQTGWTTAEIGRHVGRSLAWVSMRISLLDIPEDEAQQLVDDLGVAEAQEVIRERRRERAGRDKNDKADRGWDRSPWHIGKEHPLAAAATERCDVADHNLRRRIRNTGCGRCWEDVIRADERRRITKEAPPLVSEPFRWEGVDDVAVQRASQGDRSVRLSKDERRTAVAGLHRQRLSDGQIAQQLGVSARTVLRIRQQLQLPANIEGVA